MVSLSEETSREGYFFEDHGDDDDELTESATLSLVVSSEQQGRTISTTWCIFMEIALLLGLWVCVFILPLLVKDENHLGQVSSYSLILYIVVGLWFVQLAMDRFYRNQHYRNRLCGYLGFYRRTRNIRRLPLLISSAKLAFLLVTAQVLIDTCGNSTTCGKLSRDAVYADYHLHFLCHPDSFTGSVCRDGGLVDQVLEKQADMIRYLKKHNEQLSKKICSLSDENKNLRNSKQ